MTDPTRAFAIQDAAAHDMTDEQYTTAVEKCRLTIPPDFRSQFIDINKWLLARKNVLFLGKGPSLAEAKNELQNHGVIATVNEACMAVDGRQVDYAFFTDRIALDNCRDYWNNIKCFVCTAMVHADSIDDEPLPLESVLNGCPRVVVTHDSQLPWDERFVQEWIDNERLLTVDTSIMGLHFLHLIGLRNFRLLGHDGGKGYAGGMPNINPNRNMTAFRDRLEETAWMLVERYDTHLHFFDGEIIRKRH